jgi:hypothetical protein
MQPARLDWNFSFKFRQFLVILRCERMELGTLKLFWRKRGEFTN